MFVHTEKGAALWDEIAPQLIAQPIDEEAVVRHNPALVASAPMPKNRQAFLDKLKTRNFDGVVARFCPRPSRLRRLLGKIKRWIFR